MIHFDHFSPNSYFDFPSMYGSFIQNMDKTIRLFISLVPNAR